MAAILDLLRLAFRKSGVARSGAVGLMILVHLVGAPQIASADAIHVREGESIQRAIDRAQPGDSVFVGPGTFRENVLLWKTLVDVAGAGASESGTILLPPPDPVANPCSSVEEGSITGICITSENPDEPVSHSSVSGFLVRGFSGNGIQMLDAEYITIQSNELAANGAHGVAQVRTLDADISGNVAHGNRLAGIYIGSSPRSNADVSGNTLRGNGYGLYVRDASVGGVDHNDAYGNCIGILFLDTSHRLPVEDWSVVFNRVHANSSACPNELRSAGVSGVGMAVLGSSAVIYQNLVWDNGPADRIPFSGGIVVASSSAWGGGSARDSGIAFNTLSRNRRADLLWDRQGLGVNFGPNECSRSKPRNLCGRV